MDTTDVVREVPMRDLVEIGAIADGGEQTGAPVYGHWQRIRLGT